MADEIMNKRQRIKLKSQVFLFYKQGLSAREVKEKLQTNKSERTVGRWIREAGISRSSGGSKLKYPDIMKLAIELYKSGLNTREVAEKLSIKKGTVSKWVWDLKIGRKSGLTGEKNPQWKNNSTIRNHSVRLSNDYRKWRLSILERDNFMCCGCGQIGGVLHIHHILAFAKYPNMRMNIKNGITLCHKCHFTLHGKNKENIA